MTRLTYAWVMILAMLATVECGGTLDHDSETVEENRRSEPHAQSTPDALPEEVKPEPPMTEKPETVTPPLEVEGDIEDGCEPGWTVELVDASSEAGYYSALALDSHARPLLTYQYDGVSLRYARRADEEGWEFEAVDLDGISPYTALVVDQYDRVHVGVQVGNIGYTVRGEDGTWEWRELIPSSPFEYTGFSSSVAVDAGGTRHMSFYLFDAETHDPMVVHAHWSYDEAPVIEPIAVAGNAADYSSIAVDATGAAHLAWSAYYYGNPGKAEVYYARQIGGVWAIELIERVARLGKLQPSLALDPYGGAHLAYAGQVVGESTTSQTAWYAHRTSGGWEIETIDPAGLERPSIVAGSDGTVHATFFDAMLGRVRYARREPGGWSIEDIVSGSTEIPSSIALDGTGRVHASFTQDGIRYATRCP